MINAAGANQNTPRVKEDVMQIIQDVLYCHNFYVERYKSAYEHVRENHNIPDLSFRLRFKPGTDQRRYNLPTADEVAVILPGDGSEVESSSDIVLYEQQELERHLSTKHSAILSGGKEKLSCVWHHLE
jgi:hypothetical protein